MPKRQRETTTGIVYPPHKIPFSVLTLSRLPDVSDNAHLAPQLNPLTTLRRFPSSTSIRNNTLGSGGKKRKRQTRKKRQMRKKDKREKNKL